MANKIQDAYRQTFQVDLSNRASLQTFATATIRVVQPLLEEEVSTSVSVEFYGRDGTDWAEVGPCLVCVQRVGFPTTK